MRMQVKECEHDGMTVYNEKRVRKFNNRELESVQQANSAKSKESSHIISFSEYCYSEFEIIRRLARVSDDQLIDSFEPQINLEVIRKFINAASAGKSGMQIVATHDKKFLIKEIDKVEKYVLCNFVDKYTSHLMANPRSTFAKIYGLYSLRIPRVQKVYFIVMQNLEMFNPKHILFRYDLKFSEQNRRKIDTIHDVAFVQDYLLQKDVTVDELFGEFQFEPMSKERVSNLGKEDNAFGMPRMQNREQDEFIRKTLAEKSSFNARVNASCYKRNGVSSFEQRMN